MPISTMPTLRSNIQKFQNPRDILKAIIQHYMATPKHINDTFRDLEISFIFDNANSTSIESLKSAMISNLTSVLKRYFQGHIVDVDVRHSMLDAVRFELFIDALITIDGISYTITQSYSVDEDGSLQYNFEG